MILPITLAFATDIPPGATVIVANGASLAGGGQTVTPAVGGPGWPARVVGDDGDRLRVVPSSGCLPGLDPLPAATFTVAEGDLLPQVSIGVKGKDPTGDTWDIHPGNPVVGQDRGLLKVGLGDGFQVEVPAESDFVALYSVTLGVPIPERSWTMQLDGAGLAAATFRGVPLGPAGGLPPRALVTRGPADGLVTWYGECAVLTFHAPAPTPLSHDLPEGAIGVLIGTTGLGPSLGEKPVDRTREGGTGRMGEPLIVGALAPTAVNAVIKRNIAQVRYCYQRELVKDPKLAGEVAVSFVIGADGTVTSASIASTTMNSPPVETCIVSRFQRFVFPPPTDGGIVSVRYPFDFSPT